MILNEFLRFSAVGLLATATHFAVAFCSVLFLNYEALAANTLGFLCALSISFLFNAKWTFKKKLQWQQLFRFSVIALLTYVIIFVISSFSQTYDVQPLYSIAAIAMVIPLINFLMHKFWTFIQ